jgi:hypothetical protein
MIDLKYEYLFNEMNVLTHYSEAIRGNDYRLYPGMSLDYTFKQGEQREYFAQKIHHNSFSECGGESIDHYNAKMKIAHELKYFDTIFNEWVLFDKVIPEKKQIGNKRPDLSCYDKENVLVCCIEIMKTNAKNNEDKEKLKKIDCLITEIDINNENKCEHIALPRIFEIYREEHKIIEAEKFKLEREYKECEREFYPEAKKKIERFNNWLLGRKAREFKTIRTRTELFEKFRNPDEIKRNIRTIENKIEKLDYGAGKLESEINRVESEIRKRKQSFNEIAAKSKIEWFRNSWIKNKPQNLIQEIKYWLQ